MHGEQSGSVRDFNQETAVIAQSIAMAFAWFAVSTASAAATNHGAVDDSQAVMAADAHYWQTFNACDLSGMAPLLTNDVEFYHDKTGLTTTREGVIESLRKGPCANPAMKLRREEVPGTVKFHPLAGGFAMLTGMHRFVVVEAGKTPYVDGQAQFVTLWKLDDGQWRMHRIISYDHAPVAYVPPVKSMALAPAIAQRCKGRYRTGKSGDLMVTVEGNHLRLVSGTLSVTLYPESEWRFFAKERDLRFQFKADAHGDAPASAVTIYEHGGAVATGVRLQ